MKYFFISTIFVFFSCASCYRGVDESAKVPVDETINIELSHACGEYDRIQSRPLIDLIETERFNPYIMNENKDEVLIPNFYNNLLLNGQKYTHHISLEDPSKDGLSSYRMYFDKRYMYDFVGETLEQIDYEEKTRLELLKQQKDALGLDRDDEPKKCFVLEGRCYDPKDLCMGLYEEEMKYTRDYKLSEHLTFFANEYGAWDDSGVYVIDDDNQALSNDGERSDNEARILVKYDHSGNRLWQSKRLHSDREIPTSILGIDQKYVYVLECTGEIVAFDLNTGRSVWENAANIKMQTKKTKFAKRYAFESLEAIHKFVLFYPVETSEALAVYDTIDGDLFFGVRAVHLLYDIGNGSLFYAYDQTIQEVNLTSNFRNDEVRHYAPVDKSILCRGVGAMCQIEVSSLRSTDRGVYAEYKASGENGWVKTLVGWRRSDRKIAWQTHVGTSFPHADENSATCARYWATNHAIMHNAMIFLDIAKERIIAIDLETGAFLWQIQLPVFRAEEKYSATFGVVYRNQSGVTKEEDVSKDEDIYRYAGAVRFYPDGDKLVVVYRGIRVLQL